MTGWQRLWEEIFGDPPKSLSSRRVLINGRAASTSNPRLVLVDGRLISSSTLRVKRWQAANPERHRENVHKARIRRAQVRVCDHPACLALGPVQLAWQVNPHRCYLCGKPVTLQTVQMDHVVAISRRGIHCADNLRPSCGPCNLRKGARPLTQFLVIA